MFHKVDVVDSKVAWLQYMGYYQAPSGPAAPCHGHPGAMAMSYVTAVMSGGSESPANV